jgi:hypothetical protein
VWKIEKIISKGDYNYCIVRGHPNATKNDYVLHHRVVMENHLGRLLNSNEIIHHKNGDKKDNSLENLEITFSAEHSRLHGIEKGLLLADLKCPWCKKLFQKQRRETFLVKPTKLNCTCCSNSCRGKLSRDVQLHGITAEMKQAISENIVRIFRKFPDNSEVTLD